MAPLVFKDRNQAGALLAAELEERFRGSSKTERIVLALPRGGVPVALEVARALRAPLDLVIARKIGVPWQPELAAAAIVDGDEPQLVVNRDVMIAAGMSEHDLQAGRAKELQEIERRRERYLQGRAQIPIKGRDVIVVDDGVATGATTRAALLAVKRRRPRSLVLAVPVAPADTLESLRPEVDELICLSTPAHFSAIGAYYDDFTQVSDDEVVEMLAQARRFGR